MACLAVCVTDLPLDSVASVADCQTPLLTLVVPLVLAGLVNVRRGLREARVPALPAEPPAL